MSKPPSSKLDNLPDLVTKKPSQMQPVFLSGFSGDILVQCPRCRRCAHITEICRDDGYLDSRRLICSACCLQKIWKYGMEQTEAFRGPQLPGFGCHLPDEDLELWLSTPCCRETLWAYNRDHLDFLEQYVGARLRTGHVSWQSSLQTRLPKWVLLKHNRRDVLRAIETLRGMLPATR